MKNDSYPVETCVQAIGIEIRSLRLQANSYKEAMSHAGLSQERLGIMTGMDEMSASARMSQYERGVHTPGYSLAERFAEALDVPVEYLYAKQHCKAATAFP